MKYETLIIVKATTTKTYTWHWIESAHIDTIICLLNDRLFYVLFIYV